MTQRENGGLVRACLLALSAAAGGLDVFCVARLGGPFASVITGNLVQVGRGVAILNAALAVTAVLAVAGYGLGVGIATVLRRGRPVGWRSGWGRAGGRGSTAALAAVEVVLIAAVTAGWLANHSDPDGPGSIVSGVLLAMAGGAMGVQSVLTHSTGLRRASTTYLTGTLTGIVQGAVEPSRYRPDGPGLLRLLTFLAGAFAGGVLLRYAPLWTPVLPLALVFATLVALLVT